jgi:hypothetical protein
MDEFMTFVLNAILEHGSRAVRVFPRESGVLIAFAERIAGEVVCVVIFLALVHPLLTFVMAGWGVYHDPPHACTGALFVLDFSYKSIPPSDGSVVQGGMANGRRHNAGCKGAQ